MTRRTILKAFAALGGYFTLGRSTVKAVPQVQIPVPPPQPPKLDFKFGGGTVGTIGTSTNQEVSDLLFNALIRAQDDSMSSPNIQVQFQGTFPELSALVKTYGDAEHSTPIEIVTNILSSESSIEEGLRKFWGVSNYGKNIVNVAADNKVWLCCNGGQLFVIDCRATLGQVFFCTRTEDWRDAVMRLPETERSLISNLPIIVFPNQHMWRFEATTEPEFPAGVRVRKLKITKTKYYDLD